MGSKCSTEDASCKKNPGGNSNNHNAPGNKLKNGNNASKQQKQPSFPLKEPEFASFSANHFGQHPIPAAFYCKRLLTRYPRLNFDPDLFQLQVASVREVARDGNCFYAACIYAAAEFLAKNPTHALADQFAPTFTALAARAESEFNPPSGGSNISCGVRNRRALPPNEDTGPIDTAPLLALLRTAREGGTPALAAALPAFLADGGLYHAVRLMRGALAARLRDCYNDVFPFLPEQYQDGDDDGGDFNSGFERFLRFEVLQMSESADSLQIYHTAEMLRPLGLGVRVLRAEGGREEAFPEGLAPHSPAVTLLHTPGHFELLYLLSEEHSSGQNGGDSELKEGLGGDGDF